MIQTILNAHSLFTGERADRPFLESLDVPEDRLNRLRSARDKTRGAITEAFKHWQNLADESAVVERAYLRAGKPLPKLRPKFRQQGSYAYATLNFPAHSNQQMDFDDGMFLPISFFLKNGAKSPALTSDGYFTLVENALEPLCKVRGWKLIQKDCCVRIELDTRSHLDIALYVIPDDEFAALVEKAERADSAQDSALLAYDTFTEAAYQKLELNTIMLAQRSVGWTESDPRAIEDWFQDAVETHGPQLRRICRYFKAWRDYHWRVACKIKSILLMKCVVDAFDSLRGRFNNGRDDAAMLMVASKLADYLADLHGVPNPVLPHIILNSDWTTQERAEFVESSQALYRNLSVAIQKTPETAVSLAQFIASLGPRIPDEPTLIVSASVEPLIRSYEAKRVPAPDVVRTRSG